MDLVESMADATDWLLRQAFPPRCPGCDTTCGDRFRWCDVCRASFRTVDHPKCLACGLPHPRTTGRASTAGGDRPCSTCRRADATPDRTLACWYYEGAVAEAIRRAKYAGSPWRLRALADIVEPAAERGLSNLGSRSGARPAVAAVPMHPTSLRRRGYNVSALLARRIFGDLPVDLVVDALAKPESTSPQAELPRTERLHNLDGAFTARRSDRIAGRPWIVVDDVVTTGATIREATRALQIAGASKVVAVALARSVPRPD